MPAMSSQNKRQSSLGGSGKWFSPLSQMKMLLPSLAAMAVIGCALLIVYGRAWNSPFVFDDSLSILQNPSLVRLWPLMSDQQHPGPLNPPKDLPTSGRPLVNLTFALNYHFGGLDPLGYRLFNLIVHFLSAIFVALIVKRILTLDFFAERFSFTSGQLAFFSALLWAVHPLNTETVVYVTQRTELMVGFFYLATIYASLQYWTVSNPKQRYLWWTVAFLTCLAGMASKEIMVSAPLMVLLLERTFLTGSFRQAMRRSWPLYIGLAVGWLLLLLLNYDRPRAASAGFNLAISPLFYWYSQAKILWMYFKLVIWPWPLSIHYQLPYLETFGQAWPWLLATAALAIGTLALVWLRYATGFVGTWVLLILSPTLIVPIVTEVAAERRMYLPLAAIMALVIAGGYWLAQKALTYSSAVRVRTAATSKPALAITAAVAIALASAWSLIDVRRLAAYHDTITLWQDTLEYQPNDSMAYDELGVALLKADRPAEAIKPLQEALRLDPSLVHCRYNLGNAMVSLGRIDEGIKQFQEALRSEPNYVDAHLNLACALAAVGRTPEAMEQFQQTLQLNPKNAKAHSNLGSALWKQGNREQAINEMQTAVQLNPNDVAAHRNLGISLGNVGRLQEAIEQFQQTLSLEPNDAATRTKLALALKQVGYLTEAVEQLNESIRLQPNFADAWFQLATVYAETNRTDQALAAANKALDLAQSQGLTALVQQINIWLKKHTADSAPATPGR
jgi:protein O-mannosyl-transferase